MGRLLSPRVIACRTAKPRIANAIRRLAANAAERTPKRSGRKDPASASASRPDAVGGKAKAGTSGQGRARRPEIFTIRPASQRLAKLVIVENTAAAGGTATTNRSINDFS